jgi:hypothetical protein
MYRFIDTVSIDVMSINDYYVFENPRGEERSGSKRCGEYERRVYPREIDTDCNTLARKV